METTRKTTTTTTDPEPETAPAAQAAPFAAQDNFHPLGFDTTYGRIFQVFRDRWIVFLGIAFVVYVVGWIFAILLSLVLGNDIRIDGFSSDYGNAPWLETGSQLAFYLVEAALFYVFGCIAHGASVWVTMHWYLNQSPHPYDAFRTALDRCLPLVGATVLISLIVGAPMLVTAVTIAVWGANDPNTETVLMVVLTIIFLEMIYGMFVSVVTYVAYPAVMVEGKGPWESVVASYDLTRGHWGYIFGILLLWGVFKLVLSLIIGLFLSVGSGIFADILADILDTFVGIFLLAIAPVFEGVIYVNLRVQKEELDSGKLGEEIGVEEDSYIAMVPQKEEEPTPVVSNEAAVVV